MPLSSDLILNLFKPPFTAASPEQYAYTILGTPKTIFSWLPPAWEFIFSQTDATLQNWKTQKMSHVIHVQYNMELDTFFIILLLFNGPRIEYLVNIPKQYRDRAIKWTEKVHRRWPKIPLKEVHCGIWMLNFSLWICSHIILPKALFK